MAGQFMAGSCWHLKPELNEAMSSPISKTVGSCLSVIMITQIMVNQSFVSLSPV
jgi:hypothetical protein